MSVAEIKEEIQRYLLFFRYSGGGITYSGGEPTQQTFFLRAMVETFFNMGIDQAIESCGYFEWDDVNDIFEKLDFIFIDVKHINDEEHKRLTGVSNKLILENIKKIALLKKPLVVRIPLIKNVNNSKDNLKETAEFVKANVSHGLIELLPYHNLGNYKYDALGLSDFKFHYPILEKGDIETAKSIIEKYGVKTIDFK